MNTCFAVLRGHPAAVQHMAGQALARSVALVPANTKEFKRVPGLILENWLI